MSDETQDVLQETQNPDEEIVAQEQTIADTPAQDEDKELDIEALKAKAAKADEYKKFADRVTAENKELKKQTKPTTNTTDVLSREEAILIAQGMVAEDLDELKAVAEAKKISLLKAKDTPLFQGYLEKKEGERKKEKAKLAASRGSTTARDEKSPSDMSRDEHMAFMKEASKNIR